MTGSTVLYRHCGRNSANLNRFSFVNIVSLETGGFFVRFAQKLFNFKNPYEITMKSKDCCTCTAFMH